MLRHAGPFVKDIPIFERQRSVAFFKKLRKSAQSAEKLSSEESRPHMRSAPF
jgi:hypothetical protein